MSSEEAYKIIVVGGGQASLAGGAGCGTHPG